jgi:imidazolonepropionase
MMETDFNPGTSMTESLFSVKQLAVFTLKMSVEESINELTANASYALTRDEEVDSFGINPIKHVIKNGKVVVRDGVLTKNDQGEA